MIKIIFINRIDGPSIESSAEQQDHWRMKYNVKTWAMAMKGNRTELQCKFCKIKVLALRSHMIEHATNAAHAQQVAQSERTVSATTSNESKRTLKIRSIRSDGIELQVHPQSSSLTKQNAPVQNKQKCPECPRMFTIDDSDGMKV